MAKKKENEEFIPNNVDWNLEEIMSDRFGRYSKYIIQERALPDARDGLKPVQRRILFAMDHEGNTFEKPYRKSAKTVGYVIGTFHPHGDTSVYDAMVRMSQDWKMNIPLVDMHGNNGSMDDDPAAAMRYTEARLSKSASFLLQDIDKNTVVMTNNYDDTDLEPTVLPASYPLLMVNGSTGIASGYATNIPPHNMGEMIDATIYRLQNPKCGYEELSTIVKGPDFPTGGIVQGKKEIDEVFKTGKGKIVVRSKTEIVEGRTVNQIVVTEIPYEVIKCELVKQIDAIRLNKDIEGMSDVRDESDRNGLKIVVDVKKDANAQLILNYLFKNTDLQINYAYNMIAIKDHRPVQMTLMSSLDTFIAFRKEVVLNRSRYLLAQKEKRMHILEGLIKAISILDDIIELIRASKDKADSKRRIMEAFLFSEEQAEAIVTMRLYRLSSTDIVQLKNEYTQLSRETDELKGIVASADILRSVLINELRDVKEKNHVERKTTIEKEVDEIVIDKEAMIPNEGVYISATRDGYIRRYTEKSYASNPNSFPVVKDTDSLIGIKHCETLDNLLIILSNGEYAQLPVYRINETKWKELGQHLSQYVKGSPGGKIIGIFVVKNFDTDASILTLSSSGMIKRSLVREFNLSRTGKTSLAMKLKDGEELVSSALYTQNQDVLVVGEDGYYNRYSGEVLTPISPRSAGVKGISVKNDRAVGLLALHQGEDDLLIIAEGALTKRIHLRELPLTSRATKGQRLFKQRKSSPYKVQNIYETDSSTAFYVVNDSSSTLLVKDVPLMGVDSTFAKPLDWQAGSYLLSADQNELADVPVCKIYGEKTTLDSFDQLDLFANE